MWSEVQRVLGEAMLRLKAVLAADLPGLVAMGIVIAVALVVGLGVRLLLRLLLARMGFDRRAREWGLTAPTELKPRHEPSWLVARGAFWIVVAAGVALALDVLGTSTVSAVGLAVLNVLPRLVVACVVLLVGVGIARFLERSVLIGAVNRQIVQARLVAGATKWLVIGMATAMALEHLEIGGHLPTIAFAIAVGGVSLAGALAVGLGARDAVARWFDRRPAGGADAQRGEPPPGRKIQHL
jgi:hypothetical protein